MTINDIARYYTGEKLSELETEMDQIEVESDEEDLDTGVCDDSEDDIVKTLLDGAYSQVAASNNKRKVSTCCPKCKKYMCIGPCFEKFHSYNH